MRKSLVSVLDIAGHEIKSLYKSFKLIGAVVAVLVFTLPSLILLTAVQEQEWAAHEEAQSSVDSQVEKMLGYSRFPLVLRIPPPTLSLFNRGAWSNIDPVFRISRLEPALVSPGSAEGSWLDFLFPAADLSFALIVLFSFVPFLFRLRLHLRRKTVGDASAGARQPDFKFHACSGQAGRPNCRADGASRLLVAHLPVLDSGDSQSSVENGRPGLAGISLLQRSVGRLCSVDAGRGHSGVGLGAPPIKRDCRFAAVLARDPRPAAGDQLLGRTIASSLSVSSRVLRTQVGSRPADSGILSGLSRKSLQDASGRVGGCFGLARHRVDTRHDSRPIFDSFRRPGQSSTVRKASTPKA